LTAEVARMIRWCRLGSRYLLDKQIRQLAEQFEKEGGFTERLYNVRRNQRRM